MSCFPVSSEFCFWLLLSLLLFVFIVMEIFSRAADVLWPFQSCVDLLFERLIILVVKLRWLCILRRLDLAVSFQLFSTLNEMLLGIDEDPFAIHPNYRFGICMV